MSNLESAIIIIWLSTLTALVWALGNELFEHSKLLNKIRKTKGE